MNNYIAFPPLLLPFKKKGKLWRKSHLDWASLRSFNNYSPVRNSAIHKKINYDLLKGIVHREDMSLILNPDNIDASYIPDNIQHYSIMLPKLNVLRGEELARVFDYKVVVTNPTAVSEIEQNKKNEMMQKMLLIIESSSTSEDDYQAKMQDMSDYFQYDWLDMREIRANALLSHYWKEYNMPLIFNTGFVDAECVAEEIYQTDIVGGEPILERLDPQDVRVFRSGYSNKIEDADVIIIELYWLTSKIYDYYGELLTASDRKIIEGECKPTTSYVTDSMGNIDPRYGLINPMNMDSTDDIPYLPLGTNQFNVDLLPKNMLGDMKVLRMYWKSRRLVKKIKRYNLETGEEEFELMPETYVVNKDLGEEEEIFWINEAWEGTKIGEDIYIQMRPRVVQYNRLSNPSRCHFGIIGSIYNCGSGKPFSLVDMMKPYNYLYDAIHDRLNKLLASNWGKIVKLDLAKVPTGWEIDKWMYYAKVNHIAVEDSFKEGNRGTAMGKLAGGLNNASSGVIDADFGNNIQLYINILEFIKVEMSEVCGINAQREGLIQNRETVGGVERATLQSSHITEWLFAIHDDVKKRTLEAFLETAKIALKGGSGKFDYILPNGSSMIIEVDGDEFSECDYGLVVDNSLGTQQLQLNLESLAQAGLLTLTISFSTIVDLFSTASLAEKRRMIKRSEDLIQQRQQEAQLQQLQALLEQMLMQMLMALLEQELKYQMNKENNDTKIAVAEINSLAEALRFAMMNGDDGIEEPVYSELSKAELREKMRLFDAKLKLERDKFNLEKKKQEETLSFNNKKLDVESTLKKKQIAKSNTVHK